MLANISTIGTHPFPRSRWSESKRNERTKSESHKEKTGEVYATTETRYSQVSPDEKPFPKKEKKRTKKNRKTQSENHVVNPEPSSFLTKGKDRIGPDVKEVNHEFNVKTHPTTQILDLE